MRMFLALELPEAMRSALAGIRARLEPQSPGWRWVRPESIHATVKFLGEVATELDARARPAWRRAAATIAPFRYRLGELGRFPPSGRPRVAWVGVVDEPRGSLAALAGAVEAEARALGLEAERRPFRPHLTLARAERSRRPALGQARLVDPVEAPARELVLFRSELRPEGARYTVLERFALDGPSGSERR